MDFSRPPVPTGRKIVQFDDNVDEDGMRVVMEIVGSDADILGGMGIAVASVSEDDTEVLAHSEGVSAVRPEFYMFALSDGIEWLKEGASLLSYRETHNPSEAEWVQEGLQRYIDSINCADGSSYDETATKVIYRETAESTWGIKAVRADVCASSGNGIKVAVLDTGFEEAHPDFEGRAIVRENFSDGGEFDLHGHGTHCAGIIAGPRTSVFGRRYGVAPDVELYVGKVLGDNGSGREFDVLRGIEWAIEQGCHIVSMSLGRSVSLGEGPDPLYERVGQMALQNGSLIVAAAGNESYREYGYIAPVGSPANAPSIMAVGAIDSSCRVSYFSCGAVNSGGGEINVVAPGSGVYSAWLMPRGVLRISGTSMSCPYASAVAALHAELVGVRGRELWSHVQQNAKLLGAQGDYGYGLVRAPRS